jgi:DNA modification methylase
MTVKIIHGDCRDVMPTLPSDSFDCIVTSPPYYWARDYGVDGQMGHEDTPQEFVDALAGVFDECRRVLKETGVVWLNLGDSFYSGNGQPKGSDPRSPSRDFMRQKLRPLDRSGWDIPKKSLLGIPWAVAHELQRRGWTIRMDVIWCRETAFAEPSVTDRPHRQHEYIFLLSKARRYYFDRSELPEESVWHIPHARGVKGHSASFPTALAERCIKAGCPEGGTVLDPFGGAGTTGLVADRLGRHATLIELNPQYRELAISRVSDDAPLFAEVG